MVLVVTRIAQRPVAFTVAIFGEDTVVLRDCERLTFEAREARRQICTRKSRNRLSLSDDCPHRNLGQALNGQSARPGGFGTLHHEVLSEESCMFWVFMEMMGSQHG